MSNKKILKTIMGREQMNLMPTCQACGKDFTMGEPVVHACGDWPGTKLVHEHDAVFDEATGTYVERKCYAGRNKT